MSNSKTTRWEELEEDREREEEERLARDLRLILVEIQKDRGGIRGVRIA